MTATALLPQIEREEITAYLSARSLSTSGYKGVCGGKKGTAAAAAKKCPQKEEVLSQKRNKNAKTGRCIVEVLKVISENAKIKTSSRTGVRQGDQAEMAILNSFIQ